MRGVLLAIVLVLRSTSCASTELDRCGAGTYRSTALMDAPRWRMGCAGFVTVEPGFFSQALRRYPCPPGTYSEAEGSSRCELCRAGYFCTPRFSPELGTMRGSVSATQQLCGGPSVICPAGSHTPTEVATGFYSTGGDSEQTRVSQTQCPSGSYCSQGVKRACPAGRFGSAPGLSSPECSGHCKAGFFCPEGSVSATETPCGLPGTYCPAGSGSPRTLLQGAASGPDALSGRAEHSRGSASDADAASGSFLVATPLPQAAFPALDPSIAGTLNGHPALPTSEDESSITANVRTQARLCPPGFFCPPGDNGARVPCPAGRFSSAWGTSSVEHCHSCAAGYFCPPGSASPAQAECGGSDVYCAAGAASPTRAEAGFFTAGGNPRTRSVQLPCPAGSFCPGDGLARLCMPGSYSPSAGGTACRPCAAGFWCGRGSSTPTEHSCGSAASFCPPGSPAPINATAGYFTLRVEPAAAPADLVAASAFAAPLSLASNAEAFGSWGIADPRLSVGAPGSSLDARVAAQVRSRLLQAAFPTVGAGAAGLSLASAALPWQWARRLSTDALHGQGFWLIPPLAASIAASDPSSSLSLHGQVSASAGVTVTPSLAALQALQTRSLAQWMEFVGRAAPQHLHPELALPRGSSANAYRVTQAASLGTHAVNANATGCNGLSSVALLACLSPPGPTLLVPVTSLSSRANPPLALLAGITGDTSKYRTHERRCDMGHFCPGDGTRYPCPAGTFGNATGLTSASQCLPCMAGYFCPEASVTGTDEACGGVDVFCPAGSSSPTPVAAGHFTRLGATSTRSSQQQCPAGYFCSGGVKTQCPAGRYGSLVGEFRADCEGRCTAGYYCPEASTSPIPIRCGAAAVFCPAGSATPQGVRAGWFTVGGRTTENGGTQAAEQALDCKQGVALPLGAPVAGSTASAGARAALHGPMSLDALAFDESRSCISGAIGDADTRTGQVPCPPGSFCTSGRRYGCPPGRFGSRHEETSHLCQADCQAGFFCPWQSVRPDQVVCGGTGQFCPERSGAPTPVTPGARSDPDEPPQRRTRELACPQGFYCGPDAIMRPCRPGTFGSRQNETSPDCSGACSEGYFCQSASTSPTQIPCGNTSVYCPAGSSSPQLAPLGTYTVGSHPRATAPAAGTEFVLDPLNSTRSSTAPCPEGHYCINGVLRQCPAGVLGNATWLSSPSCTGLCPEGYFCPPGTVSAALECGAVFANSSLADLVIARGLNFSELLEPYAAATQGGLAVGPTALGGIEGARRLAALAALGNAGGLGSIAWEAGARGTLPRYKADIRSAASEHSLPITVGPAAVFCPEGTGWPVPVSPGSFTQGTATTDPDRNRNATRTAESLCPAGSFCVAGIQMPCPPGRFGSTQGLQHWTCTGTCPAGFACPLGAAAPRPCSPGTYATGGNHVCLPCPASAGIETVLAKALGDRFAAVRPSGSSGHRCVNSLACCSGIA